MFQPGSLDPDCLDLNSDTTTGQSYNHDHVIKIPVAQYPHLTNKDNNESCHLRRMVWIKGNAVCSTLKTVPGK